MRQLLLIILMGGGVLHAFPQWLEMPQGPNHWVRALIYDQDRDRLYAFGRFTDAGDQVVNGTAYYENGQWHPMGEGVENVFAFSVRDAYLWNDSVMISGAFPSMIGVPNSMYIALWNGTQWKSIGGIGSNGNAAGMLANEDGWTMAGGFTVMGGIPSSSIARYRNGTWEDLCLYPDNSGYKFYTAIAKYEGQYVFGGNINGDFPDLNEIGVLVNDSLRPMGTGILGDSWVNDMVVYDGKLFVAGEFYAGWGNPGSAIMTWDGTTWSDPVPGVIYTTQMYDLDQYGGYLFFSGQAWLAGDPLNYYTLARYNAEEICLFGKNLTAAVTAIAGSPDGLYVAYNYPALVVEGVPLAWLAKYDLSQGFDTCITLATNVREIYDENILLIYPNPATGELFIEVPAGMGRDLQMTMHDAIGKLVIGPTRMVGQGAQTLRMNISGIEPGMYLINLHNTHTGIGRTGRIVIQ